MATDREINRARQNLKGLEHAYGLVGFDFVQQSREDGLLPPIDLRSDGDLSTGVGYYVQKRDPTYSQDVRIKCWKARKEGNRRHCSWVRIKHAADWQIAELLARWPSRKIAFLSYVGHGDSRWNTVSLHPLDVVAAWFRFLWPDPLDFGERAEKYLVGFTDKYVHDFPGLGAKLRVTCHIKHPGKPQMPFNATVVRMYGASGVPGGMFGINHDDPLDPITSGKFHDYDIRAGNEWSWDVTD